MKTNKKLNKVLSLILFALLVFQQSNAVVFADEVSDSGESEPQVITEETELEIPEESEEPVATEEPTEIEAPAETEAPTEVTTNQDFTYEESGVQVELHLSSAIAEDATLSVEKIDADSFDNEAFETWVADKTVLGASIYDIHLVDANGNEIETGESSVKLKLDDIAVPEVEGSETTLTFLHITDDGTVEEGTVDEDGTSAEITANGLSPFVFVRTATGKDAVLATGEDANTFDVDSMEKLQSAMDTINSGEGSYTINITADITMTSSINLKKNTVTIVGNGHTINFSGAEVPVYVDGGTSGEPVLILGNSEDSSNTLTLNGDGVAKDGGHLIAIAGIGASAGNGTVKICDGTTIQNSVSNNAFGGAIAVGQGGYLEMNGGLITNCGVKDGSVNFGGAVAVISGGHFTMNGGTISSCYAETTYDNGWQVPSGAGGAVFVGQGATFTMNGGSLLNNNASADGGAVAVIASADSYYDNGGFGYLDSRFEMNGGTISGNTAGYVGGGVAALGTYINAYGLCTATAAAGRPDSPGIYINGGSITGNDASEGGGVFLNWIRGSIPVQIHNATISQNSADCGAGIEVMSYWTQADIDGCTIEGNTSDGKGAGIYLKSNGSSNGTTLKNTTIQNNTSGDMGAGVYYDSNSKLTISGANTIQNNTYNGTINNLNILDKDHPVYVNGSLSGSSIGLSDPTLWNDNLSDIDSSAVSTAKLTSGFKENNEGIDPEDVFTSDHNTWVPDYGEKKEDTTSTGYSSTASTWSDVKVMDTVWVCPSADVYSGLKTLYYNPKTKEYSISSSSSYSVAMILKDGTYYLAYKNNNKYYILKTLEGEPELHTFTLGGRNMTYGHFASDLSLDGYNYLRVNDFSTSSTKSISCYELTQVSNGDGYDYSNEVRLVRGYAIKYKDGNSDAYFGSIVYPTIYSNEIVTLVDPAEKAGYEFKGWYRDSAFTDGPITELSANEVIDEDGNIVLYAKWAQDINCDDIFVGNLENLVYSGQDQKQAPTVQTSDGTDLTSSDYTISYSDDTKNVGKVTVTITGVGNYTGTVTKTYDITKKELTVTTESAEKNYDGKPLTANGSIDGFVDSESAELKITGTQTDVGTSDNSYEIVWNDTTKESNYEVKESVGTLTVNATDINSDDINVGDLDNVVYNGQDQKQAPTVQTKDGTDLTSSDYTISYSDDTKNVGTVTVTITGIGNYTGTVTKTYDITKKELTVKTESAEKNYDGKPLTANGSIEGFVDGESAELKVTGSQTDVGTSDNSYEIVWNDTTKESNYEVKETVGTLTVKAQDTNNNQDSQNNNNNNNQNTSNSGNNGNTSTPQTGDNSNIALWFAMLLVSCGAVTAITVTLKKKKSKR